MPLTFLVIAPPLQQLRRSNRPPSLAGWTIKTVVIRQSGASAGKSDKYWYTPKNGIKFRSMKKVNSYVYGGVSDLRRRQNTCCFNGGGSCREVPGTTAFGTRTTILKTCCSTTSDLPSDLVLIFKISSFRKRNVCDIYFNVVEKQLSIVKYLN
jgi:hypothetical protein